MHHDRRASDAGVLRLGARSQGCECRRTDRRSHSPHGAGKSRRFSKRRQRRLGDANRLSARLSGVLSATRCGDRGPALRGRQADATAGHQASTEAGGDIVMRKTTRFDAVDYLDTEERQVAYIAAALESGDADFVRDALGLVARARGMGGIAKKAGLNRESLYKALGESGNPEFGTVMRIVRALGLTLSARPVTSGQTSKRRRVA